MTDDSAVPTFVIGLGCQRGCPASTLRALLDQALQAHRIELQAVKALASIDLKRDEPGLQELAAQLALPLLYFSSEELATYQQRLSHHSQIAFERTGCYGVAESAGTGPRRTVDSGTGKTADFPAEIRPGHVGIGRRGVKSR